jgi:hypothetical protein
MGTVLSKKIWTFILVCGLALAFALLMSSPSRACEIREEITNYPHPLKCFKVIILESGAETTDKDSMVLLLSADIKFSKDCKTAIYHTREGKPFNLANPAYKCE